MTFDFMADQGKPSLKDYQTCGRVIGGYKKMRVTRGKTSETYASWVLLDESRIVLDGIGSRQKLVWYMAENEGRLNRCWLRR